MMISSSLLLRRANGSKWVDQFCNYISFFKKHFLVLSANQKYTFSNMIFAVCLDGNNGTENNNYVRWCRKKWTKSKIIPLTRLPAERARCIAAVLTFTLAKFFLDDAGRHVVQLKKWFINNAIIKTRKIWMLANNALPRRLSNTERKGGTNDQTKKIFCAFHHNLFCFQ